MPNMISDRPCRPGGGRGNVRDYAARRNARKRAVRSYPPSAIHLKLQELALLLDTSEV
jgi:hypothetical protein